MPEDKFKEKLNPEQFRVLRQKGTETAYSGQYWNSEERGVYTCTACDSVLFLSFHKLKSTDGWPSFSRPVSVKVIDRSRDDHGDEIRCKKCQSHLGYIIDETYGERYRINSIALNFQEAPELDWDMTDEDKAKREDDEKKRQAAEAEAAKKPPKYKVWGKRVGVAAAGAFIGVSGYAITRPAPVACVAPSSVTATSTSQSTKPPVVPAAPVTSGSADAATSTPPQVAAATTSPATGIGTTSSAAAAAGSAI
jgi:peptide-methionine (R)-S-oxide reductase